MSNNGPSSQHWASTIIRFGEKYNCIFLTILSWMNSYRVLRSCRSDEEITLVITPISRFSDFQCSKKTAKGPPPSRKRGPHTLTLQGSRILCFYRRNQIGLPIGNTLKNNDWWSSPSSKRVAAGGRGVPLFFRRAFPLMLSLTKTKSITAQLAYPINLKLMRFRDHRHLNRKDVMDIHQFGYHFPSRCPLQLVRVSLLEDG